MAREINLTLEEEKDKEANRPIELYQIHLDSATLYLANHPEDIQFYDEDGNEQVYDAYGLARRDISRSSNLKADKITVEIDNVEREMSTLIANNEFRNRELVIWKVFLGQLEDPDDYIELFRGQMDEPAADENSLEVTVKNKFDIFEREIPRRKYSLNCPWEFGSEECGVEISEDDNTLVTGTVDSVDADNPAKLYLSGMSDDPQNYWAYGYIEVENEARFVRSSGNDDDGDYITVDMPFFSDPEGEDYTLTAGCDKTYELEDDDGDEVNHGCAFWDNTQRYGGFLSIPEARDVKS